MAAIFGKRKIFLKIGPSISLGYRVAQKIRLNCSISHSLGDTSIFVLCNFIILTCNKYTSTL